ncbi:MAG: alpha/beta fold hydrolase [Rhodothermales bacterium]
MHKLLLAATAALLLPFTTASAQAGDDDAEITILTSDSVVVYGDVYDPDEAQPLILLFHQAGANARAEYGPIIPRLLDEGFSVIAIDQREGGDRLGGVNRTIEANGLQEGSYCDAAPDLEATLDYAIERYGQRDIILWGSSYSAALVIRLAAERGEDVAGVLAFSPASGDPMAGCRPEEAAAQLTTPAMMLRPSSEMEIESIRTQMDSFSSEGHRTFVAVGGVHGSSMLNSSRVTADTEPTWDAVLTFLHSLIES